MATKEHWDVKDDKEMWERLVGHESENIAETLQQSGMIFEGVAGANCLEIGAGVGRLLKFAGRLFMSAIGVDWSRVLVNRSAAYLKHNYRARVVLIDGLEYPFADNSFDFVYSFTCFQHMPTIEMVRANIKEAYRVLVPGGWCRVQTVQGEPNPALFDGIVFPAPSYFLKEFTDVGFVPVKAETIGPWIWVTVKK